MTTSSRRINYQVDVQFGDCDPAGIVFFPNFLRWMDAASLNFFVSCGLKPWNELVKSRGIVGTPLLEIHTRFITSATFGQTLQIETSIVEWREKTFVQKHVVTRGSDLICEGSETRIFVVRDADKVGGLRGIAVPEDIKILCTGPGG